MSQGKSSVRWYEHCETPELLNDLTVSSPHHFRICTIVATPAHGYHWTLRLMLLLIEARRLWRWDSMQHPQPLPGRHFASASSPRRYNSYCNSLHLSRTVFHPCRYCLCRLSVLVQSAQRVLLTPINDVVHQALLTDTSSIEVVEVEHGTVFSVWRKGSPNC